jgi:hypothetical protein
MHERRPLPRFPSLYRDLYSTSSRTLAKEAAPGAVAARARARRPCPRPLPRLSPTRRHLRASAVRRRHRAPRASGSAAHAMMRPLARSPRGTRGGRAPARARATGSRPSPVVPAADATIVRARRSAGATVAHLATVTVRVRRSVTASPSDRARAHINRRIAAGCSPRPWSHGLAIVCSLPPRRARRRRPRRRVVGCPSRAPRHALRAAWRPTRTVMDRVRRSGPALATSVAPRAARRAHRRQRCRRAVRCSRAWTVGPALRRTEAGRMSGARLALARCRASASRAPPPHTTRISAPALPRAGPARACSRA